ncbi:MAG: hypothetical protein MUF61_00515 [archaeon]|jgi:hypothetical protein|nr:hypothetical protein [archaeon]
MGIELYIGADDSNHAGTEIEGEIVLTTFSLLYEDSIVGTFKNSREYAAALRWMSQFPAPARDYRFTVLLEEKWRHSALNLTEVSPLLVRAYLKDNPDLKVDTLKLYLDGYMSSQGKRHLRHEFRDLNHFVVDNFIKKGRNRNGRMSKRPRCPPVVYMADIWARMMLDLKLSDIRRHPKFVSLP